MLQKRKIQLDDIACVTTFLRSTAIAFKSTLHEYINHLYFTGYFIF